MVDEIVSCRLMVGFVSVVAASSRPMVAPASVRNAASLARIQCGRLTLVCSATAIVAVDQCRKGR